jgi:hypothetical protein
MYQYWIISPALNQNVLYHTFSQYMCHYIKNTLTILGKRKIREGDEECKDVNGSSQCALTSPTIAFVFAMKKE